LNLDHDVGGFVAVSEFLRGRDRFVSSRRCSAARNFESVGGENGFALIFVKSCRGWVLFRMKSPNVQRSTSNSESFRERASNSQVLN
jgi:hypothetical protein